MYQSQKSELARYGNFNEVTVILFLIQTHIDNIWLGACDRELTASCEKMEINFRLAIKNTFVYTTDARSCLMER